MLFLRSTLKNNKPYQIPWDKTGMDEGYRGKSGKMLGKDIRHYQVLGMERHCSGKLSTETHHFPSGEHVCACVCECVCVCVCVITPYIILEHLLCARYDAD